MTARRKKLLPAVLFVTAASTSSCSCGPKTCDPKNEPCLPDGGFYCANSDCFPAEYPDGGIEYDANGQVLCLC